MKFSIGNTWNTSIASNMYVGLSSQLWRTTKESAKRIVLSWDGSFVHKLSIHFVFFFNYAYSIHGTGIFTYIWLIFSMVNVGTYTSPMDAMGMTYLFWLSIGVHRLKSDSHLIGRTWQGNNHLYHQETKNNNKRGSYCWWKKSCTSW